MEITAVTIRNFRAVKDLRIDGFGKFNLFVGRNNVGKTTLLEALFLVSGMSNAQLSVAIHNSRDLLMTDDDDFRFMFHDLDFATPISIDASLEGRLRKLVITPQYGISGSFQPAIRTGEPGEVISGGSQLSVSTQSHKAVTGIQLDFIPPDGKSRNANISILRGWQPVLPAVYSEELQCAYLNPRILSAPFDTIWEKVLREKKTGLVIKTLQQIEPRVQRIELGTRGMLWVDVGMDTLAPIQILGDGFRHILTLIAYIAIYEHGVLLVDEIENGLHYSSLDIMWDAVLTASQEYDVQIIATTHSNECVSAYSDSADRILKGLDVAKLYRLERTLEGGHKSVEYDSTVMKTALEQGYEVR
jgi:hypothetical protein